MNQPELLDMDFYADLFMESVEIDTLNQGGLCLHRIVHPRRGPLIAVQAGSFMFVTPGREFTDQRGMPATATIMSFDKADRKEQASPELLSVVIPFPSKHQTQQDN
jgi:hypothetical protein